jgi:hypothetical protein
MKISKIILAAIFCVGLAACHEVEVPTGPSKDELLTAHTWVITIFDQDGTEFDPDALGGDYPMTFNANGTFLDPDGWWVDGSGTWEWDNKNQGAIIVTGIYLGDPVEYHFGLHELSHNTLVYDLYASFPDLSHDHYITHMAPQP